MSKILQNFADVQTEAKRCLYCVDPPCQRACPAFVNAGQFIRHLRFGDLKSAKRVIKRANPLGGVCGTLCPSEELCEGACTMNKRGAPIRIRELQKFVCANADYTPDILPPNGRIVAAVGAGPAGLACAAMLARMGYSVDVYEKDTAAAGVVAREIPGFRIGREVIEKDLTEMASERVRYKFGQTVNAAALAEMSAKYSAVFVGVGLNRDRVSGVEIEDGAPVTGCSEFLGDLKQGGRSVSGTVCVIGGGDSAIDAVCGSLESGAEKAVLAYRRSRDEMPACDEEFFTAADKGVELMYMVSPVSIRKASDGATVTFIRNRMTDIPGQTRRGFEAVPGSEFTLNVSQVVFAIGRRAEEGLPSGKVDPVTLRVEGANIFVGGDVYNGGATVVHAVGDGKRAAMAIHDYLNRGGRSV